MIYLASPYSHVRPEIRDGRFRRVCEVAAKLMAAGHLIFSPIAHTHPIAMAGVLPTSWVYWSSFDTEMLRSCEQLWVLKLDGWEDSTGVRAEIKIAQDLKIPIRYLDPADV